MDKTKEPERDDRSVPTIQSLSSLDFHILLILQVQTINNCLQTISKRSPTTQYPTSSPVSLSLAESSGGMEELREATLADIEEEGHAGEERMLQEVIEDSQLLLMQFSINQLSLEIHSRGKNKQLIRQSKCAWFSGLFLD